MCGFFGQYNFDEHNPLCKDDLRSITGTMAHRGPDDEGVYISGRVALGFRRLSIIDLEGGHQPMSDQEGSVWVVFNGEIYNFPELREELKSYGHIFRTRSDTEVIVHGYKQWGLDVLDRLNGMFGLAIWDEKMRRMMIARDRMGIKMVYYRIDEDRIVFGSEIRPILAFSGEKPDVDITALNLFLRYRYTPSPLTMFKGINKLPPGTRIIVDNGTCRMERWWNFTPVPFDPPPKVEDAQARLLELYSRAVKRQLISDVPLGLLLSGGLDSGLLLALMKENGDSWKTFTVGYGREFAGDEISRAARTAKALKAQNFPVQINRETFENSLPKIVACLEEPIASSSIVPMYHVCQRARQDVKVALIGQGPDELVGGYKRHLGVRYAPYWRSLPVYLRAPIRYGLNLLPRNEAIKRGLYSLDISDRERRYQQVFSIMPGDLIDDLFQDGIRVQGGGDKILEIWEDLFPLMEHTDELGGFQLLEIRSSLPDELLMYADKLSMAHSLELRVPYLDHEVVEYVERLPASFKIRRGSRKWLHRRVCEKYLPGEVLRGKKKGFAVNVVDGWFRDTMSGKIDNLIMDEQSLMYRYLNHDRIKRLADDHRSGLCDNHKILFSLVVFEEWLRTFAG